MLDNMPLSKLVILVVKPRDLRLSCSSVVQFDVVGDSVYETQYIYIHAARFGH